MMQQVMRTMGRKPRYASIGIFQKTGVSPSTVFFQQPNGNEHKPQQNCQTRSLHATSRREITIFIPEMIAGGAFLGIW